jgi:esterase/lipase superfamily enzyme
MSLTLGRQPAAMGLALLLVAGCAARGALVVDPAAEGIGGRETVIVSTSRAPAPAPTFFASERRTPPAFARFEVSVPPDRAPGVVTFPTPGRPDPAREFVVLDAQRLPDAAAFRGAIDAALAAEPTARGEAMLFVHGFNVNFAEALLRQAQLQHDLDRHDVAVLFSWPSAGSQWRYIYDRESALFSRPALEETIAALAASDVRQFNLVAHSMGAFLLMDTFAAMARLGYDEAIAKINVIILMSPDIEVDVFKVQARPVLERGVPIVVFASRRDEALRLSALIRGEQDRLGSVRSEAELDDLPVTVYDITEVRAGDPLDHFAVATSPALLGFLRNLQRGGDDFFDYTPPPGRGTVGFVIAPGRARPERAPTQG